MSTSSWALVALNAFTLAMAVVGLTAQHADPMSMALALTLLTTVVNGAWVLRRGAREAAPPEAPRQRLPADEMDARTVLDIGGQHSYARVAEGEYRRLAGEVLAALDMEGAL